MGDRLGGHFVQGISTPPPSSASAGGKENGSSWPSRSTRPGPRLLVSKGSIAVDGVSLTLVDVWPDGFSVMLIPHTLAVTTLGLIQAR